MPVHTPPQHPVKSIEPVLEVLESMGLNRRTCLKGTGIMLSQLENPQARVTFQQELAFYRNALELTGDPLIGLKLGEPFIPQRYGLFGYALLSASTFRKALNFAVKFGQLTFSFFTFEFGESGGEAWFAMKDPPPIETRLHDVYLDRDMSAATVAFSAIIGEKVPITRVELAHDGHGRQQDYRDYFDCDVRFISYPSRLLFEPQLLDARLPQSDPDTSQHFRQQCRMLIAQLKSQSHFTDDVRMLLLARPGEFPDIQFVAEKIHVSVRTLRRRLSEENSSFRQLLEEVRFQLSKEYLMGSNLPLAEIAELLGFSEPGNFSHAFRRWSGQSPRQFRTTNFGVHGQG
ncbi:MAG: AraC family transcriptional regulator [Xanthomonadales bacterium]|nr:AraC family transcriptional regulator [Xanthomonadales bacterium]